MYTLAFCLDLYLIKYSKCYKQVEFVCQVIRPKHFPQNEHIIPRKFSFIPNQQPPKAEEEITAVCTLQVFVQGWVHKLKHMVQDEQLMMHTRLVSAKVGFLNKLNESGHIKE